jgi:hypothetical protein
MFKDCDGLSRDSDRWSERSMASRFQLNYRFLARSMSRDQALSKFGVQYRRYLHLSPQDENLFPSFGKSSLLYRTR